MHPDNDADWVARDYTPEEEKNARGKKRKHNQEEEEDEDEDEEKDDRDAVRGDDAEEDAISGVHVEPCELASVRTVVMTLPKALTQSTSTTTSAIVTRHITLRLSEAAMDKPWEQVLEEEKTPSSRKKGAACMHTH
jgi:hypothetical protein